MEGLPPELFALIFQHLTFKQISRLSRVSRTMYHVVATSPLWEDTYRFYELDLGDIPRKRGVARYRENIHQIHRRAVYFEHLLNQADLYTTDGARLEIFINSKEYIRFYPRISGGMGVLCSVGKAGFVTLTDCNVREVLYMIKRSFILSSRRGPLIRGWYQLCPEEYAILTRCACRYHQGRRIDIGWWTFDLSDMCLHFDSVKGNIYSYCQAISYVLISHGLPFFLYRLKVCIGPY